MTDSCVQPEIEDVAAAFDRAARPIDGEQIGNVVQFGTASANDTRDGTVASEAMSSVISAAALRELTFWISSASHLSSSLPAGVAEWQTQGTHNPPLARACRFESGLRHHSPPRPS